MLSASPTLAAGWISETQSSAPRAALCDALLKRLNQFSKRCAPDAIETYPEFSEPPWETVDVKEHIDLIGKLVLYTPSPAAFFAQPISMSRVRASGQYFVDHGGKMQVWHTRLLSNFGDNADQPAPPGEQTVVMLTTNVGAADPHADCPGKVTKNLYRPIFIVTPELSGPDSRVKDGTASVLATHRPVIYKGKTLLIGTEDIFEDFPNVGMKGGVCSFKFVKDRKSRDAS